jgi:hypothetical protein
VRHRAVASTVVCPGDESIEVHQADLVPADRIGAAHARASASTLMYAASTSRWLTTSPSGSWPGTYRYGTICIPCSAARPLARSAAVSSAHSRSLLGLSEAGLPSTLRRAAPAVARSQARSDLVPTVSAGLPLSHRRAACERNFVHVDAVRTRRVGWRPRSRRGQPHRREQARAHARTTADGHRL